MSFLPHPGFWRIDAAGLCDAERNLAPASLLLQRDLDGVEVIAVGSPPEIDHHPAGVASSRLTFPNSVLLPGLVNAHTHLDLTNIGPRPYDHAAGFGSFVDLVRRERPVDPAEIDCAVRAGVKLLRDSGTVAVGDIAGAAAGRPTLAAFCTLKALGMRGISYLEFFAIGHGESAGMARVESLLKDADAGPSEKTVLGLQPHAPTTVSRRAFSWGAREAAERGMRLCTHLAETPEEREFIVAGSGPHRAFLERLGLWNDVVAADVGRGATPVAHLGQWLLDSGASVVHLNDVHESDFMWMQRSIVIYCPRASEYFRQHETFGPHPYRQMLGAGLRVALGTDSMINQPSGELSVLGEMRHLFRRDGHGSPEFARQLIGMGTVNGAASLGLDESRVRLTPGSRPLGILAVGVQTRLEDAALEVMESASPVTWVWGEPRE
jgi:cytosine/adenosine deaminase-related metal-dependent hydrolase